MFGLRVTYDVGDNDFSFSFKFDLAEAFRRKQKRKRDDFRRQFYFR